MVTNFSMKIYLVYITAKNQSEAKKLSTLLVKERYVACANIIQGEDSIYRWKGKIVRTKESIIFAKTNKKMIPKLIKKVRSIHSYDCPCIVFLPIADGNRDFLKWVDMETRGSLRNKEV